jgi:hypothetical protein
MADELAYAADEAHEVINLLALGPEHPGADHRRTDVVGSASSETGEVSG